MRVNFMNWEKKGLIYCPDGKYPWAKKYAFPPNPIFANETTIRVYVAFCDDNMRGRVGYVDVSAENPSKILQISNHPVLDIGAPGMFDENGIVPTSVTLVNDKIYLYYTGYQLGYSVRYYQFEGLAISSDGGKVFKRYIQVPILDRSNKELLTRSSAFVLFNGNFFEMWYSGGSEWIRGLDNKCLPVYNIRYLKSKDGLHWGKTGHVCINFQNEDEHALAKPYVLKDNGLFRMFYSVRSKSKGYRIGYAESNDGLTWERKDEEVGIDVSDNGWDSKMISYGSVIRYKDKVYMFYCGNNCGETGFGYAVLKK
jgi:predicted GH43/DUF377 family glycosyl hydrolase